MKNSIRLHKDFGLNPTMPQCIICGGDTGEIALLGAAYKGEAPRKMLLGVEPCKQCREKYLTVGVLLVEADQREVKNKMQHIPTGKVTVLKDEAFTRIFDKPIPPKKICYVEIGLLDKIGAV